MTLVRQDAVETLTFLAGRDLEGFAALVSRAVGQDIPVSDPVSFAETAALLLAEAEANSHLAHLAAKYEEFLAVGGASAKAAASRASKLKQILAAFGTAALDTSAASDGDERQRIHLWAAARPAIAVELPHVLAGWSRFREDFDFAMAVQSFWYSSHGRADEFASAAAAIGGVELRGTTTDLTLANLSFSAFIGISKTDDPEVVSRLRDTIGSPAAGRFLYSVDWSAASRLGTSPKHYARLVSSLLPGFDVRILKISSGKTKSVFIGAAREWRRDFEALSVSPLSLDNPYSDQTRAILGFLRASKV